MPPKKQHNKGKNKSSQSSVVIHTDISSVSQENIFTSLGHEMETKERDAHRESQSELHDKIDSVWKLLISGRKECRSLIYQFLAAILIEMEDLPSEEWGLKDLTESILIDPRMGDQHISKLPRIYHDKVHLCIEETFLKDKNIGGNVNKYALFLRKWHGDLIKEIQEGLKKQGLRSDYIIKDGLGNNIIDPKVRAAIKEIIKNNEFAKGIRENLKLSEKLPEEKEQKAPEAKPKAGIDYYIDYLLAENEDEAQKSLDEAARLKYIEDESQVNNPDAVICDEYYVKILKKCCDDKNYKFLETILLNGARKNSATAQHFLSEIYECGIIDAIPAIPANPAISGIFCKLAAAQGFIPAKHNLAYNHLLGSCGIKKDTGEALRLFKETAKQGYADSQNDLGCIYSGEIKSDVTPDNQKAIRWWKIGIAQGDSQNKFSLGKFYLNNGNKAEGIKLIREAADQGLSNAQNSLGACYIKGDGVPPDPLEGLEWIRKAALQGNKPAMGNVALYKSNFDLAEKHPRYYLPNSEFNFGIKLNIKIGSDIGASYDQIQKEIENSEVKIESKTHELVRKTGFDLSIMQEINEAGWTGLRVPMPSAKLNNEKVRELLGIDRVKVNIKLTSDQQKILKQELPRCTIENDPNDNNAMLITWPINNKAQDRKIAELKDSKIRALLGIDRLRLKIKLNPDQQKALQSELPSTIENDPEDPNAVLITWHIRDKEKDRKIIDEFTKKLKEQPNTKAGKPRAKATLAKTLESQSQ